MSTRAAEYLDAIDHLPQGGMLVLDDVSWEEYDRLVEELAERHLRVSYDCGKLQVVSPLREHEAYKDSIYRMVCVYCEMKKIQLETCGSTTWRRRKLQK